ncbi:hypothetical protein [Neodiprion sertifer nucleopolyhedrovirus]|uniref:Uncharacterized protein n=1 Tax=Neodiprion sertifer nucleopolyhedrovirus TaxID=111874 RepID=Q6JKF6_9CBAC|nr:hypothetical protein NeseNPV_gp04 [Neodiprion sertifer nucleopolyhedrovirus]AAQ96381.1 hypothetical protein [Neodiprion sertifer nucleopolyhedrovirus]
MFDNVFDKFVHLQYHNISPQWTIRISYHLLSITVYICSINCRHVDLIKCYVQYGFR